MFHLPKSERVSREAGRGTRAAQPGRGAAQRSGNRYIDRRSRLQTLSEPAERTLPHEKYERESSEQSGGHQVHGQSAEPYSAARGYSRRPDRAWLRRRSFQEAAEGLIAEWAN